MKKMANSKHTIIGLLLLFWLCCFASPAKAQLVDIPDPVFRAWLENSYYFKSCMQGTPGIKQLNTQCNAVLTATSIDVSYWQSISSLEGIQHFTALQYLGCSSNQLTSLPTLPNTLIDLNCSSNQLTSLPTLPNTLTSLKCFRNQLTALPTLPSSLVSLSCDYNQLTSLPILPNSLIGLGCSNNQLTGLPTLPNSLQSLSCGNNPLGSLPTLPTSLQGLDCDGNQLTNLPALPNSLTSLSCSSNQLTSLPTLPNTIIYLECKENLLSSLPTLPTALTALDVRNNRLTTLPANIGLCVNLGELNVEYNLLTSLPASIGQLKNLYIIRADNNQLTSLPVEIGQMTNLVYLYVFSNLLTSLPAEIGLLPRIRQLIATDNQISSLPIEIARSVFYLVLNNNKIKDLPNYYLLFDRYIDISGNELTFEDLYPFIGRPRYAPYYSPQAKVGVSQTMKKGLGSTLTLTAVDNTTDNEYKWFKDGVEIIGETSGTYSVTLQATDFGVYTYTITNTNFYQYGRPELTLKSNPISVELLDPCNPAAYLNPNWYFGKGVGLKFSANAPSVIANVAAGFDAIEGSASVSDINDVPLFYTNGEKLYKADGTVIKSDLGGSRSATQSSLFVPKPGSSDTYYLFVTGCEQCISPNVGVHYYEVNTNGNVNSPTSFSANGERITAIKKPNVDEYWIISTTGAYLSATLLKNTGFSSTPNTFALQNILPNESHPYSQIGYLKASPDGSKLALVYQDRVFIFNFSVTTGAISNQITIDNLPFAYGLEFSADNNYLYVSTRGILSQIHQINLGSNTRILVSNVANSQVGALQIGPDNHIYVAKWNSKYLGKITGASSASPSYEENAVLLGEGKFSRLGLPNLIRTPASTAGTRTDANQSDYASNANATGLALWLDASDFTGVDFRNAYQAIPPFVFNWFDRSGNNRHFSITDGAYAPVMPVNDYWHFYANFNPTTGVRTPEIHFIRNTRPKRTAGPYAHEGSILIGGQEQNCNTNTSLYQQFFPGNACGISLPLPPHPGVIDNQCISPVYNQTLPPPCPNGPVTVPGEEYRHRILGVPMTIIVAMDCFGLEHNVGKSHIFGVGENRASSQQGTNNIWGLYLQDGVPTLRAKTDSGEGLEIRAKNADGTNWVINGYTVITAVLRNDGGEIYINSNSTPAAQPLAGDCSQVPRNNSLVDGGHIPTIGATRGALDGMTTGITSNMLHGAIGAIKVWNRVLTEAERISEVNIMKPKWNIQ